MLNRYPHFFFAFLFASVTLFSCVVSKPKSGPPADPTPPPPKMETERFIPPVKATVLNYEVDGCHWILELENGKKLQPLELETKFQKDKLAVWITYDIVKDAVSNCMAGEIVKLSYIGEE